MQPFRPLDDQKPGSWFSWLSVRKAVPPVCDLLLGKSSSYGRLPDPSYPNLHIRGRRNGWKPYRCSAETPLNDSFVTKMKGTRRYRCMFHTSIGKSERLAPLLRSRLPWNNVRVALSRASPETCSVVGLSSFDLVTRCKLSITSLRRSVRR